MLVRNLNRRAYTSLGVARTVFITNRFSGKGPGIVDRTRERIEHWPWKRKWGRCLIVIVSFAPKKWEKKILNYTSKWDGRASQSFSYGSPPAHWSLFWIQPKDQFSTKLSVSFNTMQIDVIDLCLQRLLPVSTNRSKPKSWDGQVTQLTVPEREKVVWALATPRTSVHRASWAFEGWEGQRVWRVPLGV